MTPEERLDRIEHLTAGWVEQSKREHEENRRLWREQRDETQAIWRRIEERDREFRKDMETGFSEMRREIAAGFAEMRREMEARDRITDGRIRELVLAIGELVRHLPTNGKQHP